MRIFHIEKLNSLVSFRRKTSNRHIVHNFCSAYTYRFRISPKLVLQPLQESEHAIIVLLKIIFGEQINLKH